MELRHSVQTCLQSLNDEAEKGRPYHVVFLSLSPHSLEVAKQISTHPNLKRTKLILISDYAESIEKSDMLSAGFSTNITKPFKQSQIFDAIVTTISDASHSIPVAKQFKLFKI